MLSDPAQTKADPAQTKASQFPTWVTTAAWIASYAIVFFLCIAGSPWDIPLIGVVNSLLGAIPLSALAYLTWRIHRYHNYLSQKLEQEAHTVTDKASRRQIAEGMHHVIHDARESDGPGESLLIAENETEPGLWGVIRKYVLQRCRAREELRLDALRNHVESYLLDQVEPFQRWQEQAFGIGLAGALLGLVVQIVLATILANSSILSGTFLTGVVIKASATFMGILVASYARLLRWRHLEKSDDLLKKIEDFASSHILPVFAKLTTERDDMAEVLRKVIRDLQATVAGFERNLEAALTRAISKASEVLVRSLNETLASFIQKEILDPFRKEVEKLNYSISKSGDAITEGVQVLMQGVNNFKKELTSTVNTTNTIFARLQETGFLTQELADRFEAIIASAENVTRTLSIWHGEVELHIEQHRERDTNHQGNNNLAVTQFDDLAESLQNGVNNLEGQIQALARLVDGANPSHKPRK